MYDEDDELEELYEKAQEAADGRMLKHLFLDPEVCKRCGRTLKKHEHGYHYQCAKIQGIF